MMKYRFPVTITDVFERRLQKHATGFGPNAVFTTDSAGWYIKINNDFSIYLGMEKPSFEKGEKADLVIIRKTQGGA